VEDEAIEGCKEVAKDEGKQLAKGPSQIGIVTSHLGRLVGDLGTHAVP
jgi:hypothetical protein